MNSRIEKDFVSGMDTLCLCTLCDRIGHEVRNGKMDAASLGPF